MMIFSLNWPKFLMEPNQLYSFIDYVNIGGAALLLVTFIVYLPFGLKIIGE